jgi:UDP-N-acetylglucosamine--N-acetylmuramyl-(pentapeptide) pyrophosphoryl-undecaprenol N-acetylglucosamine transferase
VHQSGEADFEATRTLYEKFDLPAEVVPFLGDMPTVLANTALAICRAGGTTLAELAAVGVPAILLPYPHATDDHQAANAKCFSTRGGCVTIDERLVADRLDNELADMLCFLLANEELRGRMAAAMRDLARPNAADDVAELVWSIVSSRSAWPEMAAA